MTLFASTHQARAFYLRWHILPVRWHYWHNTVQIVWRTCRAIPILYSLPSYLWWFYVIVHSCSSEPCFPAVMHPYVHGSRFAWLHDCMIAWLHDCMIAWLHDCMIAWLHDCMNICRLASLATKVKTIATHRVAFVWQKCWLHRNNSCTNPILHK